MQQLLRDSPSSPHVELRQHLDDLYDQFLQILWHADSSLYCESGYDPRKTQPSWWNDMCMDALLARNAAWRERRRNPNAQTEFVFSSARNKFHRVVRTAKQSFWSSWLQNLEALAARCPCAAAHTVRRRFRRNSTRVAHDLCPNHAASPDVQRACLNA